mmetsp:Transcript_11283/g.69715  ORF Transcript_11283/g.69715 Transcript_11283/m.69715 type:complete len:229 (-) Transcript_11283:4337-5023(-)
MRRYQNPINHEQSRQSVRIVQTCCILCIYTGNILPNHTPVSCQYLDFVTDFYLLAFLQSSWCHPFLSLGWYPMIWTQKHTLLRFCAYFHENSHPSPFSMGYHVHVFVYKRTAPGFHQNSVADLKFSHGHSSYRVFYNHGCLGEAKEVGGWTCAPLRYSNLIHEGCCPFSEFCGFFVNQCYTPYGKVLVEGACILKHGGHVRDKACVPAADILVECCLTLEKGGHVCDP